MPVATQVGFVLGHHHDVKQAWRDRLLTTRTGVCLLGVIGLDGMDRDVGHPRNPQATRAAVIRTKRTTRNTSIAVFFCSRNGLNPMTKSMLGLTWGSGASPPRRYTARTPEVCHA